VKRREIVCAALALALLLASVWLFAGDKQRQEEVVHVSGCELRLTILGRDASTAKAIVFHGLTANRRIMLPLARSLESRMQVFLFDHPGHGDSTQPFAHERAEFCAATAVDWLEKQGRIRLEKTVLIGHSMGGGIAVRLADQFPTAATVAISIALRRPVATNPARLEWLDPPRRMPVNLFLINAEYDWPELKDTSRQLVQAAGGERFAKEDFQQRRAVKWQTFPRATHTSLIVDRDVNAAVWEWIENSLPGDVQSLSGPPSTSFLLASGPGLLGLFLLFPLAATWICSTAGPDPTETSAPARAGALAMWAIATLLAVLLQARFITLAPIVRMYGGDYLASVLMLVGVLLLMLRSKRAQHAVPLRWDARAIGSAAVLGLGAMLAFGAWLNWQTTDLWLNSPRGWRFAVVAPLVLPYFVAEEVALGPRPAGWRARLGRFAQFLGLRTILWLAMAAGVLWLGSAQILMPLLVVYMAAFSIAQRLGMDAVRRRTGSAAAAAVFGAVLAAWFIAGVFPTK
jgi:pimeloyl-ACP methyl ester carboxylesterase